MPAADQTLKILLQVKSDVADLAQVVNGLKDLGEKTESTKKSALGLKDAFAFEGARKVIDAVSHALAEIPARILEGIKSGVEFNAEMQELQTSMAGVLRLTQSDQFGSFAKAKEAAGVYIEEIKKGANDAGIAYHDMFSIVEETQAQLSSAGVTSIHEQIEAARLLVQAMKAVGVSAQNAKTDIGDILQGTAAQTQGGARLSAALHLTKEEFDKMLQSAIASGNILDVLRDRFSALGDAMNDSANNADAGFNRLKNLITDLQSEAAKPIMEPLSMGIQDAVTSEKIQNFRVLARMIGEIAAAAINAAGEIVKLGNAIAAASQRYQGLVTVLRTISQITPTGLLFHDFVADAFDKSKKAVEEETAAIKASTGALDTKSTKTQRVVELTEKQREAIEKVRVESALLVAQQTGNSEEIAVNKAALAYRNQLDALRAKKVPEAESLKAANEIYVATYNSAIASEQKKSSASANRAAAEGERDAHRAITDLLAAERLQIEAIKADIANVEQNPFLTIDQKDAALIQLISKEIKKINDLIADQQNDLANSALDPSRYKAVQSAIQHDSAEIDKLQLKLKQTSFTGKLQASLVAWVNQFGDTANQVSNLITSTIGTAVSGLSNAITGLIFRTTTWGQAFAQVAQAIVGNIIQIVLQWAVSRAVMAALNFAFGKAEGQAINAEASAATEAWSPAAIAASIASYGAAAGAGNLAFIAALVSGTAFATGLSAGTGGFEKGGFTGEGRVSDIAGFVHRQEYVFDAPTVERGGGPIAFDNLRIAINRPGYERGGSVGGSSSSSRTPLSSGKRGITIIQVRDERQAMKEYLKSSDAETHIVRTVNSRGGNLRT